MHLFSCPFRLEVLILGLPRAILQSSRCQAVARYTINLSLASFRGSQSFRYTSLFSRHRTPHCSAPSPLSDIPSRFQFCRASAGRNGRYQSRRRAHQALMRRRPPDHGSRELYQHPVDHPDGYVNPTHEPQTAHQRCA